MIGQTVAEPMLWRSELLSGLSGVTHAITGRVAGMGLADGNVAFSAPRDKADAWAMRQRWSAAASLDANRLVTLGQIHGAEVHRVSAVHQGRGATPGSEHLGLGDALVTSEPGPVLMTLHADCQPVLFVDPARRGHGPVVAVAHAGWRGTVANVVGQALAAMMAAFGTRPADVHVCLGPAIGPCCYEVGDEVAGAWAALAGADAPVALTAANGRPHFSLRDANALLLARAGVQPAHLEVSPICTRCEGERWFSHRGQGAATGRFGAMIAVQDGGSAGW
jgi:YfiH family protein